MPITKAAVVVLAATSVAAGTTKAAPVAGAAIDCRAHYGGELTYKITNGATAPTVAGAVTFQASHNGTTDWFDYYTAGGDAVASSVTSGAVLLDRGVMYVRVIGYGNTVNAVTVEAHLQAVTAV